MRTRALRVAAIAVAAFAAAPVAGTGAGRDDTQWLQARLDERGGRIFLPKLPGGQCYATRGLWVSHDDTTIASNGACIVALGHGPVRLSSFDRDPIPADALFFVNRSRLFDPTPVRVRISGLELVVPRETDMFGIGIYAHQVTVSDVTIRGAPVDGVIVSGRANGDGYAGRVTIADSRLYDAMRNGVSATAAIDLRIERNVISGVSDSYYLASPAAGIDIEPGGRGSPALGIRIAGNTIADNAGPGILLALSTNIGLPVLGTGIEIVGNRITGNGRKASPPQVGGIVFNGGQDEGGGRVVLRDNVITGNRGYGLDVRGDVNLDIDAQRNDLSGNSAGPRRPTALRPMRAV